MHNVVNISGGKDSTATLLLALERQVPNLSALFADTGHESPITYEYVDTLRALLPVEIKTVRADFRMRIANKREYIMRNWVNDGVPQAMVDRALEVLVVTGIPMLDLCLWKGRFPSPKARFCTDELKIIPINQQGLFPLLKHGEVTSWQGVRRDESRARVSLPELSEGDAPGLWNYRPILDWTAADVFAIAKANGIPVNPLYTQGMGRVGCLPCIMARKNELMEIGRRFPEEVERVKTWERLVSEASKQGLATFLDARHVGAAPGVDVHFSTHGIDAVMAWAKTAHGGKKPNPEASKPVPMCESMYGLCE